MSINLYKLSNQFIYKIIYKILSTNYINLQNIYNNQMSIIQFYQINYLFTNSTHINYLSTNLYLITNLKPKKENPNTTNEDKNETKIRRKPILNLPIIQIIPCEENTPKLLSLTKKNEDKQSNYLYKKNPIISKQNTQNSNPKFKINCQMLLYKANKF